MGDGWYLRLPSSATGLVVNASVDMAKMTLGTLLLASTVITITAGKLLQLSNDDKGLIVNEHNLLRAGVAPAAVDMKQMV